MANNKFCTECGQRLEEGVKFCPNCGNAVPAVQRRKTTRIHRMIHRIIHRIIHRGSQPESMIRRLMRL